MTWRAVFCNLSRFYDGHSGSRGEAGPEHGVGGLKKGSPPMPVTASIRYMGISWVGNGPFFKPPAGSRGPKAAKGVCRTRPPAAPRGAGGRAAQRSCSVRPSEPLKPPLGLLSVLPFPTVFHRTPRNPTSVPRIIPGRCYTLMTVVASIHVCARLFGYDLV